MSVLAEFEASSIYHCAPLHYAPFILRSRKLFSRRALEKQGFTQRHFRSSSSVTDADRGFENFVFCAASKWFPLIESKLDRGFPHFLVDIPVDSIDANQLYLCRYNIAKSRVFRSAKKEPAIDIACEEYVPGLKLPVAHTAQQKKAMLATRLSQKSRSREVIVSGSIEITSGARLIAFSNEDKEELERIARCVNFETQVEVSEKSYVRCSYYVV
jgi:hypothetical protein